MAAHLFDCSFYLVNTLMIEELLSYSIILQDFVHRTLWKSVHYWL